MTKTKNRKGKKKYMKHLDNAAARSETVHQQATLSPGVPAGGLAQYLQYQGITPDSPPDAVLHYDLLDNPATNGQHADFEAKMYADHDAILDQDAAEQRDADLQDRADRAAHFVNSDARRVDLATNFDVVALRKYSRGSGIKGAYGMKKADLIEAIIAADWYAS